MYVTLVAQLQTLSMGIVVFEELLVLDWIPTRLKLKDEW
jgi:hypothetical protein